MPSADESHSHIEPIPSISPTAFNTIRDCALKALWSLSRKTPLLPQSPKARVGIVAHKLLAESGQGQLQPHKDSINARWNELIEEAQAVMSTSPLEVHLVPLKRSVPDMEVRRIRTIQRAFEIANVRWSVQTRDEIESPGSRYGHEFRVRSSDGLIRGTIDAVIRTDRGAVIQDYKSGPIMESDGDAEFKLKESYQTQLKMYAALYAESCGEWPTSLELVPLSGEMREVVLERAECLNLLDEARVALKDLNATVLAYPSDSLPSLLARPNPVACSFCPYRPACKPYQTIIAETSGDGWPLDVVGVVIRVRQLGNSKLMLQLNTHGGSVNIPGLSTGNRHPNLKDVQSGDFAGIFNLRLVRKASPYSESQLTTVHKLEDAST